MDTNIKEQREYNKCRCLYCTGECLCYECDHCGVCDGQGCGLSHSRNYMASEKQFKDNGNTISTDADTNKLN